MVQGWWRGGVQVRWCSLQGWCHWCAGVVVQGWWCRGAGVMAWGSAGMVV